MLNSPKAKEHHIIDLGQTSRLRRLHSGYRASSIHCMKLSRLARRIVAGVTGLTLLMYLSTGAAQACVLSAASPQNPAMSEPCCETAQTSTSAETDCCQEHYLSQQVAPAGAKLAALAAVELPSLTERPDQPLFAECATASVASLPSHAKSPPPHTLYCRLRN